MHNAYKDKEELKNSLETYREMAVKNIKCLELKLEKNKETGKQFQEKFLKLKRDFEDRSLGDNIRIDGLKEFEKKHGKETKINSKNCFRTNLI